jgi:hypothetical protein
VICESCSWVDGDIVSRSNNDHVVGHVYQCEQMFEVGQWVIQFGLTMSLM